MADAAAASHIWGVIDWFQIVGLGATAGLIGQGIRAVVGLKKVGDTASATATTMTSLIEPSRLLVSLLIGAIAGALAATTLFNNLKEVSVEQFFGVVAAGYAGADFIEGFIGRVTPDAHGGSSATAKPNQSADGAAG